MILHIPHSSRTIPAEARSQFVLSDADLEDELLRMTDAYTDELFSAPDATTIRFPYSRLLVDVERFPDDALEPMSQVGMGILYNRTAYGEPLRRTLDSQESGNLRSLYDEHHQQLTECVAAELTKRGHALIVDCHSFPDHPLPCDQDQSTPRPEMCIGTDPEHTSTELVDLAKSVLTELGHTTGIDVPYSGALVPMPYFHSDQRVGSIMIEVNRRLYMDEGTGKRTADFKHVQQHLQRLLSTLASRQCG